MRHKTGVTNAQIKETKVFQGLSYIQRRIASSGNNMKAIKNNILVVDSIGIEKWREQSNPTYLNKQIVEELIKNRKNDI